ncbi:hypothetical protein [Thiomicrorhabdus xiamenensis]|uniref:Uncharacterized protein n=1 Tax=Thiomicrorhabdus xiamenensis TaxID=2739063 RepID=A0A7D4TA84_9GAMM|nr:hypothetical protein [Thiomicrorhabdus xiamenensis]QKI89006.1 hypothetical protein HQN79_05180 [Thiomicrorhabdus xiamenensis]
MHYTFPKPLPQIAEHSHAADKVPLCLELQNFVQQNIELIDRKLIRDLSYINPLAYYKEGMQIEKIEPLGEDLYQMHFSYRWHIFSGCMGMEDEGLLKDKVKFSLNGEGSLSFDLHGFGELSTADEL